MHRFRCDELEGLKPGASVRLEKSENAHLFKTLRAAEGERCLLMDGRGNIGEAEVAAGRTLILRSRESAAPPEPPAVHLYIAPPRRQKMDQILKQCTELGVRRIVPVICERSVSLPDSDSINGRWTELMFEACKQSGNAFVPETCGSIRFPDAVNDSRKRCGACFFGAVSGCAEQEMPGTCRDIAWFIGPEGGFTEAEEKLMRVSGFHGLHFGNWVLRVETAAVCGTAILMDRFAGR